MNGRGELTDKSWAQIEPFLPAGGSRGGQWRDHRQVLNGILRKIRTGAPWRDLPERCGPWKTCHERLGRWTADGTWYRIFEEVVVKDDAAGNVEWTFSIDSSVVRRPSTRSRSQTNRESRSGWVEQLVVDGEGLGLSRGGLSSKIHLAVDGRGLPVSITVTPGQAGDNPQLVALLDQVSVRRCGPERPRQRPDRVIADKAYSHPSTREALRKRRIRFTSHEKADQIRRRRAKGSAGGRPPVLDPDMYRDRNVVERCFARLKHFRDQAIRCAKRLAYWRCELIIATIVLWLR